MSLLMGAVVVGSAAVSIGKNRQAKQQDQHTAMITGITNDITKYQSFSNAAIQSQELQDTFVSEEATAATTAAAQGRRSSSGSVQAISTARKNMLDKNIARIEENAALSGSISDLGSASAKAAADAAGKAGDWTTAGNIISSVGKLA